MAEVSGRSVARLLDRLQVGRIPASTGDYFLDYLNRAPISHSIFRSREALAMGVATYEPPVLDLGCGFGEFAGVFFDSELEIGVDISQPDVALAVRSGSYRNVLLGDARRLPLPTECVNTVISVSVLEHIGDLPNVFAELYRVLRSGGKLIYTVPTPLLERQLMIPSLARRLRLHKVGETYVRSYNRLFQHVSVHTKEEWQELARAAGFQILSCEPTLSRTSLRAFELLMPLAIPSQVAKTAFGRRPNIGPAWSRRIWRRLLATVVAEPSDSEANIAVVARKP